MKLSFKKQPRATGLAAVANPYQTTDIKANGEVVGYIYPPRRHNGWTVAIAVEKTENYTDNNPNCPWMWVFMSRIHESEPNARQFVKDEWPTLIEKYVLHSFEG